MSDLPSATLSELPPLGTYGILTTLAEAWIYGFNCMLYIGTVYVISYRRSPSKHMLLASSSFLFLVATAHFWVTAVTLYNAFILLPTLVSGESMQEQMEATALFYLDTSSGLSVAGIVLYLFGTATQDFILLWRLHVVWRQWWIVALAGAIEAGVIGCSFTTAGLLSQPSISISSPLVKRIGTTSYTLHLIFNCGVTLLISGRLWAMGRRMESIFPGHSGYGAAILTLVESGSLYAVATAVNLGLFIAGVPIAQALLNVLTQLATLTPMLIIVRVGFSLHHITSSMSNTHSGNGNRGSGGGGSRDRDSRLTAIRGRQTKQQQRQQREQQQQRTQEMRIAVRRDLEFAIEMDEGCEMETEMDLEMDEFKAGMEMGSTDGKRSGRVDPV